MIIAEKTKHSKEFKSALDLPCNPMRTLVWFGLVWFYGG
jgi:hypothetical protein